MAQRQIETQQFEKCIVPVCREYKIPYGEIDLVLRKSKEDVDVILRRGAKSFKISYGTWLALASSTAEAETARSLLLGTAGQHW